MKDKRSGTSRKLAYITAPDHVSRELLKLNGERFKKRPRLWQKQINYQIHPCSRHLKHA